MSNSHLSSLQNIPENIKNKIILDCIILKKNNYGWKNIHNYLIHRDLHLKMTFNKFFNNSFKFYKISRVNHLFFYNQPYIWLKKSKISHKVYFYHGDLFQRSFYSETHHY